MLLYNLSFPCKEICGENELYFRGGTLRDGSVFVKNGEKVSFDTYFNCFSHIKYKKYTKVTSVTLRLSVEGKGVLSICRYVADGVDEVLAKQAVAGECELSVDISNLLDKGFLYFAFLADGEAYIRSGGWYTNEVGKAVKIGIVICTYKREQYLRRNVANLKAYMQTLGDNRFFDVVVVDNGQTLNDDFGEGIKVIPNENTGGSGGFTRGMKDVCRNGNYTHFLLMDDDILFDVNILRRTYSLLSLLKIEYKNASVGGGMLVLDRPYLQEELGANWKGNAISSQRRKLDARKRETICGNEEYGEPDYNAWFYMCMPTIVPKKHGYPLPFFIRCDDIEYGLRAAEHIIVSSGIAVWHEGFDNKYSPEIEYYIKRNELITSARHPKGKGAFANWMKLVRGVGKQLVMQRYFAADLMFKAYADFFRGPEYFLNLDSAKNHAELRKYSPRMMTAEELKSELGIAVDCSKNKSKQRKKIGTKNVLTLNGYFIPKCFYKKDIAQVDVNQRLNLDAFYKKRKVLQYNAFADKGFITEIKKSELWKSGFRLLGYFFKMMFTYRHVAKKYAKMQV